VIGPAPGGYAYWEIVELLTAVADKTNIVGFEVAELMPSADIGGRSALVAARIVSIMINLLSRQTASQ